MAESFLLSLSLIFVSCNLSAQVRMLYAASVRPTACALRDVLYMWDGCTSRCAMIGWESALYSSCLNDMKT